MARDPENYKYFENSLIGIPYAINKHTGQIIFEDGTRYTQEEVKKLKAFIESEGLTNKQKGDIIRKLHDLKRTFCGTVQVDDKNLEKLIQEEKSAGV